MTYLHRSPATAGQPIAARLRRLVYLLGALLLLVCVTAVGAVQLQSDGVNRLTLTSRPAFDANVQILQAMTDAETGLRGYEVSQDRSMLEPYLGAYTRTMASLAMLQDKLALGTRDSADAAPLTGLESRQRLAVTEWWAFATSTEHALSQGERTDAFQGRALFDRFRHANAALGGELRTELDQAQNATRTISAAGMAASIAITLAALLVVVVVGYRAARSLSQPLTELRDTMTRQREGEPGARAREDHGSLELRSLAAAFNALTESNLDLQQTQARGLSMHRLTFAIERAIRTAPDTQHALELLCAALGEGLGVDRVMANTFDADHKILLGAQWHLSDLPPLGDLGDVPDELVGNVGQFAERLGRSSEPLALDDLLAPQVDSQERSRIFYRDTGARAAMVAPIGLGDRIIGVIYVITVHGPRGWTKAEANAIQQVAAFVGWVIVQADHEAQQSEYVNRLERLDRQRTDFLSAVSHELRTPLTSIGGYLEMFQDGDFGELTAEQDGMLEVMDRNTSRLGGLIEDLLVLNRIDSGPTVVVIGVSLRELITHADRELSPIARRGAIELDIDAGPEAAIVQGDKGSLERAVVNIVANAIKFSRPGGRVTIRCTVDHGARRVLVTCRDRGIGIPAADQGLLFTRFYRASNAVEQAIPGTGLGLAIVQQIVQDHGGEMRLTSVEGEGTTVVMDLPLSPCAQTPVSGSGNDSRSSDVFGIRA